MTRQDDLLQAVAGRNFVRVRVAAIVVNDGHLLVQKPTDDPDACYAFIGGMYEVGDTLVERLRLEFEEETTAKVLSARYLFVVENRWRFRGQLIHGLEHYFEATIDHVEVRSREVHLAQHWLPIDTLTDVDLRPHIVRDAIASGEYRSVTNLVVPFSD